MATMDRENKKGILQEICTQTDWSLRLHRPALGALLLLLLVIVNQTWYNYSMICESIPFFFPTKPKEAQAFDENDKMIQKPTYSGPDPSRLKASEWRRLHQACLQAICKVADTIEFDCQVDETGESAHMLVIDDPISHPITFDSEIPFPYDCHFALELMVGPDKFKELSDNLRSHWFKTETIDFIHLYENHLESTTSTTYETVSDDGSSNSNDGEKKNWSKKKALFQILPGQCAVWEIFQQSWYEWYDDDIHGEPPSPIPLVNFGEVQPGEVVRIRAREYLCYEEYIPKEKIKFWMSAYETVLKYRWSASFVAAFVASTFIELVGLLGAMARFLPLTICFLKFSDSGGANNDPGGYKMLRTMMELWRIWMHLIGIHVMASAILLGSQVYVVCLLATSSMLLYYNTKASMEWIFLHILSYGMELVEAVPTMDDGLEANLESKSLLKGMMDLILRSMDDAMDLFIPMPGLCLKAIVVYMIYMSSSRLLNKQ